MKREPRTASDLHHADLDDLNTAVRQGTEAGWSYICQDFALALQHSPLNTSPLNLSVAYRTDYLHFLYITQGTAEIQLNLQHYTLAAGNLLVVGEQSVYRLLHYSPDLQGATLVIRPTMLNRLFANERPALLCDIPVGLLICLTTPEQRIYFSLLQTLLQVLQTEPNNTPLIESMTASAVYFANGLHCVQKAQPHDRKQEITLRFLRLVQQHCCAEKRIGYYADLMAISKDHLSEVVRTYSGTTAQEWIARAVLSEAQIRLKHTDQSIGEIAFALGFPNQSFFCRYFRRLTAQSPKSYRLSAIE